MFDALPATPNVQKPLLSFAEWWRLFVLPRKTEAPEEALLVLRALEEDGALSALEELAREKDLVDDVLAVEVTLREHAGFFRAFFRARHRENADVKGSHMLSEEGVLPAFGKMLSFFVRHAPELEEQATSGTYPLFAARAAKEGLNVELFLNMTLAIGVLLALASGEPVRAVEHLRAEREAFPKRAEERRLRAERAKKGVFKAMLAEARLDAESVFRLLRTPIGPERGVVMHAIHDAVRGHAALPSFGEHTEELLRRVKAAQAIL